jgi:hypothetical protein
MTRPVEWIVSGLVGLGLAAGAAAQGGAGGAPDKPKMVCKRTTETGSLVAKRRECRSKEDWDRIYEAARMNGQDMVDKNMGRAGFGQ